MNMKKWKKVDIYQNIFIWIQPFVDVHWILKNFIDFAVIIYNYSTMMKTTVNQNTIAYKEAGHFFLFLIDFSPFYLNLIKLNFMENLLEFQEIAILRNILISLFNIPILILRLEKLLDSISSVSLDSISSAYWLKVDEF